MRRLIECSPAHHSGTPLRLHSRPHHPKSARNLDNSSDPRSPMPSRGTWTLSLKLSKIRSNRNKSLFFKTPFVAPTLKANTRRLLFPLVNLRNSNGAGQTSTLSSSRARDGSTVAPYQRSAASSAPRGFRLALRNEERLKVLSHCFPRNGLHQDSVRRITYYRGESSPCVTEHAIMM